MAEPIIINEHRPIPENRRDEIKDVEFVGNPDYMCKPQYLGIDKDFKASYYIGAEWLVKGETAVVVLPEIEDVDFIKMFLSALENDDESNYFSRCYGIDFDQEPIKTDTSQFQLAPLLILHYIKLLENLAKRGLKRGYITREENLKSKTKGKILFTRHLRANILPKHEDRIFCSYQEYTADIPENRLLKKALLFAERAIVAYKSLDSYQDALKNRLNVLSQTFQNVSDEIEIYQVRRISTNKIYKEYAEAIKVAKMILQRFQYSINQVGEKQSTPPFWIDMARLYEMWVLAKLRLSYNNEIEFQVDGYCRTKVDFIKKGPDKWIIDAKYKPRYENSNAGIIDDIREISGYARDKKILNRLKIVGNEEVKCLIVYPKPIIFNKDEQEDIVDDECKSVLGMIDLTEIKEIKMFRNFYKISVPIPTINKIQQLQ